MAAVVINNSVIYSYLAKVHSSRELFVYDLISSGEYLNFAFDDEIHPSSYFSLHNDKILRRKYHWFQHKHNRMNEVGISSCLAVGDVMIQCVEHIHTRTHIYTKQKSINKTTQRNETYLERMALSGQDVYAYVQRFLFLMIQRGLPIQPRH